MRQSSTRFGAIATLFGSPPWQANGLVANLLDPTGLDWPVPDSSTLCRRQKTLIVHIPCRPSGGVLHLLIDSTGVKAEDDGEWLARTHGPSKKRGRGQDALLQAFG
jgi:hypothetical protein